MNLQDGVWLASYPRSGNTFLRTILWHCFEMPSASIYPQDLGGNRVLERYVGHIEHQNGKISFPDNVVPLVKTHKHPSDTRPAIYVIRDGRAASISMWEFYNKEITLPDIIHGNHLFGTWSEHIEAWSPWTRPNTLLIEYQDMISNLGSVLTNLSEFLQKDIVKIEIPNRDTIANSDGQWVKKKSDWRDVFIGGLLEEFNTKNIEILTRAGYEV